MAGNPTDQGQAPNWINRNPWVAAIPFVIAIAVFYSSRESTPDLNTEAPQPLSKNVWFYDLSTDQTFAVARDTVPPVNAPNAKGGEKETGVRAYVYGCGGCTQGQTTVAYVETYVPEARDAILEGIKKLQGELGKVPSEGEVISRMQELKLEPGWHLVKRPADADWQVYGSKEAGAVYHSVTQLNLDCRARGAELQLCNPPD